MAAMDASRTRPRTLFVAATLFFNSSLILLPFVSVGLSAPISRQDDAGYKQRNTILGSRPPRCINKCNACKPCLSTLVAQRQHRVKKMLSSRNDDDGYYLLAWKCRCRNKLFQP